MSTPTPVTVLCFSGDGAEQNISKAIEIIIKTAPPCCAVQTQFQKEEPIREGRSHKAGRISLCPFVKMFHIYCK